MAELALVKEKAKWRSVQWRQPLATGYIHVAAAVDPPRQPGPPFPRRSERRAAMLNRLKQTAAALERLQAVERATLYRAVLVPPAEPAAAHPARFDVAALIETASTEAIGAVQGSGAYRELVDTVQDGARDMHVMTARCARLIADVDKSRRGLYLFNHFAAEDAGLALELWERLAGWYVAETGLDNSTLLQPIGAADYVFVNHARWDHGLLRLMLEQFARPSFWTYVRANLRANRTVAMPVLYRLA